MTTTSNLRLGLLFGRPAVDRDGQPIGHVHDIRLRRDGPIIPGFGPALRVDGLIIGRASIANRLGLDRHDITGPWPLNTWGKIAARRALYVPWEHLDISTDPVQCDLRRADIQQAHE
jgi:hypothetical protein